MLSDKIKSLRLSHQLSQVDLAKKLNLTKQTISNWESDTILPSIEKLIALSELFNVTTDFLLDIDSTKQLNVTGLTEEQIGHISQIINDFKSLN